MGVVTLLQLMDEMKSFEGMICLSLQVRDSAGLVAKVAGNLLSEEREGEENS